MKQGEHPMNDTRKAAEMRLGVNILIILAVLTAVEFGVALLPQLQLGVTQVWPVLIVIALIKAILVIHNYMHFPRLLAPEEGGH
jgi:hypothetical protein